MARYLVTGGCGFIGSHLCDSLIADGHQVVVVDDLSTGRRENLPTGCELAVGDAADGALVAAAAAGTAGVFHLAAIASVERSNEAWRATHVANQTATVTVLEVARSIGRVPVVYASSAAVYGQGDGRTLDETAALDPLTAYGADKLGSELHARIAHRLHGVPTTGLRFFNVYGPRQDPKSPYSGVIAIFAERLLQRRPVTVFGDGRQSRDFVYVGDVVRFLRAGMATRSNAPRVTNVCTGRPTPLLELIALLGRALDVEPEVIHALPRPGDIQRSCGDPTRAQRELGVSAAPDWADGPDRLLDWLAGAAPGLPPGAAKPLPTTPFAVSYG